MCDEHRNTRNYIRTRENTKIHHTLNYTAQKDFLLFTYGLELTAGITNHFKLQYRRRRLARKVRLLK